MNNSVNQLEEVTRVLTADLLAADAKISIFTSAAISFKQDSLLTPFPKAYIDRKAKNFDRLNADVERIPDAEDLMTLLMADNTSVLSASTIDVLHSILVAPKYSIETIPRSRFEDVLSLCKKTGKVSNMPTHIFKINYSDSGAERRFRELSRLGIETKFAFHGTRFYNLYSILNNGLQQHLNKQGLFGEGLYFAQELDVSLLFSPSVLGWAKSRLGDIVSCVCVAEYINDPSYVKVRKENAKNSDIPHSYLLITNNEIVRVRYILIYGSKRSVAPKKPAARVNFEIKEKFSFMMWCRKNPVFIAAFLYFLMLFFVGVSNHRVVEYYKNIISDFVQKRLKFL